MNIKAFEILLKKRNIIVCALHTVATCDEQFQKTMSLQAEFMKLGYMFTETAFKGLLNCSASNLETMHRHILPYIAKKIGALGDFQPMYKGFPEEVINKDISELFFNAIVHYWSEGRWTPPSINNRIYGFEDFKEYKLLNIISQNEMYPALYEVFKDIMNSNAAVTEEDKLYSEFIFSILPHALKKQALKSIYPPFKENLVRFMVMAESSGVTMLPNTVTDVLRYAVHKSGGDITLSSASKFKNFSRKERRTILHMIDSLKQSSMDTIIGDMQKRREKWLILAKGIHAGEYKYRYRFACELINILRNQKVPSWQGIIDGKLAEGDIKAACALYKQKPGVFARALDYLIRTYQEDSEYIIDSFASVSDRVSTPVIIQLIGHFKKRANNVQPQQKSLIVIPGQRPRIVLLDRKLAVIIKDTCDYIIKCLEMTLFNKFVKLPRDLGPVYINPGLKRIPVPFNMRYNLAGMRTRIRGSRYKLDTDHDTVRAYCHWYDEFGEMDLDLSANICDADFKSLDTINFSHPRTKFDSSVVHSGDVRRVIGHCAEYIDFSKRSLKEAGGRYIFIDVRNYENEPLRDVPKACFGVMSRKHAMNGKIYDPRTIKDAIQLESEHTASVVVAIDLETDEIIWLDVSARAIVLSPSSPEFFKSVELVKAVDDKMSLYRLLEIHSLARGECVIDSCAEEDKMRAKTVYDLDLAHDYAKIQADFMS